MTKKKTSVAKFAALQAGRINRFVPLTDEEAEAMILAIRRGVSVRLVDEASDKPHGTTYSRLGRWAMRRCRCFAKPQGE